MKRITPGMKPESTSLGHLMISVDVHYSAPGCGLDIDDMTREGRDDFLFGCRQLLSPGTMKNTMQLKSHSNILDITTTSTTEENTHLSGVTREHQYSFIPSGFFLQDLVFSEASICALRRSMLLLGGMLLLATGQVRGESECPWYEDPNVAVFWSLDNCDIGDNHLGPFGDFDEFTPQTTDLSCANVTSTYVRRQMGSHSCVDQGGISGLCAPTPGTGLSLSWQDNSPYALRLYFNFIQTNGEPNTFNKLEFFADGFRNSSPTAADTMNYGIRILKNGLEIYKEVDIELPIGGSSAGWDFVSRDFTGNPAFTSSTDASYLVELYWYHPAYVPATGLAFEIADIRVSASCGTGECPCVEDDVDGDLICGEIDIDDDNDGIPDIIESGLSEICPVLGGSEFPEYDYTNCTDIAGGKLFSNIGVFEGVSIDMTVTDLTDGFISCGSAQGCNTGDMGFTINDSDGGTTADIRFYEAGTSNLININWGVFLDDLDAVEGIAVDTSNLFSYVLNSNNGMIISYIGDKINFDSNNDVDDELFLFFVDVQEVSVEFTHTFINRDVCFCSSTGYMPNNSDCVLEKIVGIDTDNDGIDNHLDLDSDNDGILDVDEAGHSAADSDDDGRIDGAPAAFGSNGLYDPLETVVDNGVLNYLLSDSEVVKDSIYDAYEVDADGDGCPDAIEGGGSFVQIDLAIDSSLSGGVDTVGVPLVASSGQSVGSSANALVNTCYCPVATSNPHIMYYRAKN